MKCFLCCSLFHTIITDARILTFSMSEPSHLVSICRLRLLKRLLSFWTSASCLSMSGQCSWNLVAMLSQLFLAARRFCSVSATTDLLDLRSEAISCQSRQQAKVNMCPSVKSSGIKCLKSRMKEPSYPKLALCFLQ